MNKTITMYELLGLIKEGKAPKKIKTENTIYELNDEKAIWVDRVYHEANKKNIWLSFTHIKSMNAEVEILEEEKKIEQLVLNNCDVWTGKTDIDLIVDKINEIIDCLNNKGGE